jgi:hypothetical protein
MKLILCLLVLLAAMSERASAATQCALVGGVATNIPCTPQQFGAVADGGNHPLSGYYGTLAAAQAVYPFVTSLTQQVDYAALKEMSNTALGADGAEHGTTSPQLNMPMVLPCGIYNLGADTWKILRADGIDIAGTGTTCVTIESSGIVFQTDGLWYSNISSLTFTSSGAAAAAVDIDGNTGNNGTTFGVQANNFFALNWMGLSASNGFAMCRVGGSGGQCSENVFYNPHGQGGTFATYYQSGFNALDNIFIGGDFQNYTTNGIYLVSGSIKLYGTSFESTHAYTQIANGGCDINASSSGAEDSIIVDGIRSESFCVYLGAFSQWAVLRGVRQTPGGYRTWASGTPYSLNDVVEENDPSGFAHMYRATTAGTSGGTQPTWPASGTVGDGSTLVWTLTPYTAVSINEGTVDLDTSLFDQAATVVTGAVPSVSSCGSGSPTPVAGSRRNRGQITEGSGATGCTISLAFWQEQPPATCTVTSPSGSTITSWSVATTSVANSLVIVNPTPGTFAWQCWQ